MFHTPQREDERPASWEAWLTSRQSANYVNSRAKAALFETFDASITKEDCVKKLLQYNETAFLYKQNISQCKVSILHHFQKVGGTIYDPNENFGAIEGLSETTSSFLSPDMDTLTDLPTNGDESVPTPDDFFKVTSVTEVKNLKANDSCKFFPCNFIPVPPFLIEAVEKTTVYKRGDAAHLLLELIKEIKEFDDRDIVTEQEQAKSSCLPILNWLFLVMTAKVYSIPATSCTHKEIREVFRNLECSTFGTTNQPTPTLTQVTNDMTQIQRPLELLATNQASTQEVLSKLTDIQSKNNETATKSFKKVPKEYQHMILVASSRGTVVPTDICEEANEFYSSQDKVQAQLFLNTKLEKENIECCVSIALTTLFGYGNFIWASPIIPSGLSSMVIASKEVLANNALYSGIILELSTKHEISKASLSKLTKTQILLPSSIDETLERLKAVQVLARIFFGEESILTENLLLFCSKLSRRRLLLKTNKLMDELFIAKLLYSVDRRINK